MQKIQKDNKGFSNILPMVLAIIIAFALIFIGVYINGTIHEELASSFPTNTHSGLVDTTYWHNGTTTNTSRNVSLPCAAANLDSTAKIFIYANTTQIGFNLSVNGNDVNRTDILAIKTGVNHTIPDLITAGNISGSETYINFTFNVSDNENQIQVVMHGTYFADGDYRDPIQNSTYSTMGNTSTDWDSSLDIVQVVIVIMVLAAAIGAIFLFTRFR